MRLPSALLCLVGPRTTRRRPALSPKRRPGVEALEGRVVPANPGFPITFQTPGLVAKQGVHALVFGQLQNTYTPAAGPNNGQPIPTNTWVYLWQDQANLSVFDYAATPASTSLPLIDLYPSSGTYPQTNALVPASLTVPSYLDAQIQSGQIVFNVGPTAMMVMSTSGQTIPSPTAGTNPNDKFGLFEWGITTTQIDFDVSEVDQVGLPFTVTVTGAKVPPPADPALGVGMKQDRDTLFNGYSVYLNGLSAESNAGVFLEGASTNADAPFPVGTRLTAPQDIVDVIQGPAPIAVSAVPTNKNGTTPVNYYYAVTATNATGGENGGVGESMMSNILTGTVTSPTNQGLTITWQRYPYATGYNVYWSASSDLSNAKLVKPIKGGDTLSWTDNSPGGHGGLPTVTPPANNFQYDPLNRYFSDALADFFNYYRTTEFVLDDQATKTLWKGTTADVSVNGTTYTMLQLTGYAGQWGDQFKGKTVNVYQPVFADNTDQDPANNGGVAQFPAAPGWLTNPRESPSSMVFGADGVFGQGDQGTWSGASTLDIGDAKDVYNNIVSALNRGITPRKAAGGGWTNVLPPSYWAASPLMTGAAAATGTGGTLPAGLYRYVLTAVNVNGQGPAGTETTPSNYFQVQATGDKNNTVTLSWNSINPPAVSGTGFQTATAFNVYRSQYDAAAGTWSAYQYLTQVANGTTTDPQTPTTTFPDDGSYTPGHAPPFVYYADGSTANFYAGYFSLPEVSINGLSYGFPYADKNGQSTNVQMAIPASLVVQLKPWTSATHIAVTQSPPAAVAGAPFAVTLTAKKASGAVAVDFTGTVAFQGADPRAMIDGVPLSKFLYQFKPEDRGVKTFQVTLFTAKAHTITILEGGSNLQAHMPPVQVRAAAARKLVFAPLPASIRAGSALPVTVRATDAFGNLAPAARGVVTLRGGGLPRPLTARIVNGFARFRVAFHRVGRFQFVAVSGFGRGASAPFSVHAATRLRLDAPPSAVAGATIAVRLVALTASGARDEFYAAPVEVRVNGQKVVTVTEWDRGVAIVHLTLPAEDAVIDARDRFRPATIGRRVVRLLP